MTRPIRAMIDTAALRHNFSLVRRFAPMTRVLAVIKADGYGHGLLRVAEALGAADGFGVASVEEGVALRRAGFQQHICLFEGFYHPDELAVCAEHSLSPVIHHKSQMWDIENAARLSPPVDVWLKVDTGMHRLGFRPEEFASLYQRLRVCMNVAQVRVLSHLANADNKFDPATADQTARFNSVAGELASERSLANSAGIFSWPSTHFEWVRPGIMLYGASPTVGVPAAELDLKPVMTLESEIIAVNQRRKGDRLGYGGDWVCPEDMPVGVVAAGYGDGYPRRAPAGTPVLVNGARAALIGRVSMDLIMVDLRECKDVRVGDRVVLWGEGLPVDEVAQRCGTISYELLCQVTPRVPRDIRDKP